MYTLALQGKDIIVTHPQWQTEPQVIAGWTWHAELVRQLIAERDDLRARLAAIDAAPTVAYVDGNNLYLECQLQFPAFNYQHQFTNVELIARPEAK